MCDTNLNIRMNDDEIDYIDYGGMRKFLEIGQSMVFEANVSEEPIAATVEPNMNEHIFYELTALSDRMRSIMETQGGDYALGYEMAMQRAADMIDAMIRRNRGE